NKADIEETVSKALDGFDMSAQGQELTLTLNDKVINTVTLEDKYLENVSFDEDTKVLTFALNDGSDFKTIDISLAFNEYAKKIDVEDMVETAISKIVDSAPEAFDTLKEIADKLQDNDDVVSALTNEISNKASKEEVETLVAEKQDKGDYVEWTASTEDRKHIVLENHDNILGKTTDNTMVNLAMVSKWDVADFGSKSVHLNLNTTDSVTINDSGVVATKDYVDEQIDAIELPIVDLSEYAKSAEVTEEIHTAIENIDLTSYETIEDAANKYQPKGDYLTEHQDVSMFATKDEVKDVIEELHIEDYAKSAEVTEELVKISEAIPSMENVVKTIDISNEQNPNRRAIALEKGDMLLGGGNNLVMLNKWGVVDLGTNQSPINLNTPKGVRPTVQEAGVDGENAEKIAYISDLDKFALKEDIKEFDHSEIISRIDALEAKEDKDTVYDDTEIKESIETLNDRIVDLENIEHDSYLTKEEAKQEYQPKGDYLTEHQSLEGLATEEFVEESIKNVVKFEDFNFNGERKTIQLDNYDSISGKLNPEYNDGVNGAVNIAMVSKWNKVDLGSTQLEINLNGPKDKRPTYNDDFEIALMEDIPTIPTKVSELENDKEYQTKADVDERIKDIINEAPEALDTLGEIANKLKEGGEVIDTINETLVGKVSKDDFETALNTKQDKGDYLSYVDIATENDPERKAVVLKNHDMILGTDEKGGTYNLAMVSKWNVADFGSNKLHLNLNSVDAITINDNKGENGGVIATISDVKTALESVKIPSVDGLASEEWVKEQGYLTEHQDLTDYAKKSDIVEYDDTEIKSAIDELKAFDHTIFAEKDEVNEQLSEKQDKGNYLEYEVENDDRKVVKLNNNDIIGAIANTSELADKVDIDGWVSLLHLNRWNVVDLGSPKTVTNINTPKDVRPTVQEAGQSGSEAHKIAYVDDIYDNDGNTKFITEHQSLEGLATEEFVEEKVADAINGVVLPEVDLTPYAKSADVSKLEEKVNDLENAHVQDIESVNDAFANVDNTLKNKVGYFTDGKSIVLENHGMILGTPNEGEQENKAEANGIANIAMLSKWNVMDFGSVKYPINLNGVNDRPTYNDDKEIALLDDVEKLNSNIKSTYDTIESVDSKIENVKSDILGNDLKDVFDTLKAVEEWSSEHGIEYAELVKTVNTKADKDELNDMVKYQEFTYTNSENETSTRKTIQLNNYDTISGVATDGTGHNLVMLSKWDVADFGATGVHMNLNSKDGNVTINDDKVIATTDIVDGLISKTEVEENYQSKGNYLDYAFEKKNPERKVITLNNTDIFMGKVNKEDLEGKFDVVGNKNTITLLQLNKWNVVDLGSPYTMTNINTPNGVRPTVQEASQSGAEAHKIAYVDDLDGNVKFKEFTYVNSDNESSTRKTIELSNYDSISGLDTNGVGHNLVMLSKWDVADFGSTSVHLNLNGIEYEEDGKTLHRPTYNDKHHIAFIEDVMAENEKLKEMIGDLASRLEKLEALVNN
ncbi:MAG: hypothetical protein K2H20_02545, partial [Bacilli bacterium]|nr:hypothetical protein [Bacilli bacterium]